MSCGLIYYGIFLLVGCFLWDINCGIFAVGYPTMGESIHVLWDNLLWDTCLGAMG